MPFPDHRALELRKGLYHLHHHPPSRDCCVVFSVIVRKPAPALPIRSMMVGTFSFFLRYSQRASLGQDAWDTIPRTP